MSEDLPEAFALTESLHPTEKAKPEVALPVEVWEQIITLVDPCDYPSLLLTSRTLHKIVHPRSYKSIYYVSPVPGEYRQFANQNIYGDLYVTDFLSRSTCPGSLTHQTKIQRIDKFFEIMNTNAEAKDLIQEFSMEVYEKEVISDTEIIEATSKTIPFVLPGVQLRSEILLTKLVFKPPYEPERCPTMAVMRTIFAIPTLRALCIYAVRSWKGIPVGDENARMRKSSNIESLTLLSTVPVDNMLDEILSWPKRLLHYHHDQEPDDWDTEITRSYEPVVSADRMIRALFDHRETLQTLSYNHGHLPDDRTDDRTSFGTMLKDFRRLEKVSTGEECLNGRPRDILPQGIKALWIELEYFESLTVEGWDPELCNWLRDMAEDLPNLEHVVLWQYDDCIEYDLKDIFDRV